MTDSSKPQGAAANTSNMDTLPALTAYVADFAVGTREQDIPAEVQALGKKAILDALGVALPGSIS